MKIYLRKRGKNIEIAFDPAETTQSTLYEDSSNVELNYNLKNNSVTVTVTAVNSFFTDDITAGARLYMNSTGTDVLINTKALFDINYPLVFPSGGSGSIPTLGQVVTVGNQFDDVAIVGNDNTNNIGVLMNADGSTDAGFFVVESIIGSPNESELIMNKLEIRKGNPVENLGRMTKDGLFFESYNNPGASAGNNLQIKANLNTLDRPEIVFENLGAGGFKHTLTYSRAINIKNTSSQLPAINDGILSVMNPSDVQSINLAAGPATISNVEEERIVIITAGSSTNDLDIDTTGFSDNMLIRLLVQSSPVSITSATAIYGNTNINQEGLYFITYNAGTGIYLSHV